MRALLRFLIRGYGCALKRPIDTRQGNPRSFGRAVRRVRLAITARLADEA